MVIIWAKNISTGKIEAFIVEKTFPGVSSKVIKGKMAVRVVENCEIQLEDVFVPEGNKLPGAKDFQDANQALLYTRLLSCWLGAGIAFGGLDACLSYAMERRQFGVPIAGFQLNQEKLARCMGDCHAMMQMAWTLTNLYASKRLTIGRAALGKAWVTYIGRQVVRSTREIVGGNGILIDYHVMTALLDMEAAFTFEGTYDINMLVAGRELTGIAAFKV
jgi:acyl-CoA oxidase